MKIHTTDLEREVLVIAEIGNNHEGDFKLAEDMIHAAAEAGVQAVKFQTIVPERLVAASEVARIAQLQRFAFSPDQFRSLADTARSAGVMFLSTPFSLDVVEWLDPLVPAFKVSSGDNDFEPLLRAVARTGKPVLLSTGMSTMNDVHTACRILDEASPNADGKAEVVVLQCTSAYPCPPEQANLAAIRTIAQATGRTVGYSDHTLGIEAAVLSVAAGVRAIEKHFTLSKTQSDFRDHQLSADPAEMAELVSRVRAASVMVGSGDKVLQPNELPVAAAARRSVVAARELPAGHVVTIDDLDWLRPGGGIRPSETTTILGRTTNRSIAPGATIAPDMVS